MLVKRLITELKICEPIVKHGHPPPLSATIFIMSIVIIVIIAANPVILNIMISIFLMFLFLRGFNSASLISLTHIIFLIEY